MICYVLFIDGKDIVEDLFCQSIAASSKAQDVFEILDTFVVEDKVEWSKCVGACTDDDPSIPGRCGPLKLLIQAKFRIHCGPVAKVHRQAIKVSKSSTESGLTLCGKLG